MNWIIYGMGLTSLAGLGLLARNQLSIEEKKKEVQATPPPVQVVIKPEVLQTQSAKTTAKKAVLAKLAKPR